ncbi:MAG: hypothetical protein AABY22_10180 [Nanoarchaeota archaeon]
MQLNDEDAYAQVSELSGVKIVDNSFVKSYIANGWGGLDFRTKCRNLGRESRLYDIISEFSSQEITYSDEMLSEFRAFSTNLKILYYSIGEGKDKASGRLNIELNDIWNRFGIVLNKRRNVEGNTLKVNKTENYLSEESDWKGSYFPVSVVIGSGEGVKKSYFARYGSGFSRKEHDLHDERIFAKALGIARDVPVYILTGDSDFIRMHKGFYEDIDFLSKLYGFKIPEYEVNIVARFKGSPLLILEPHEEIRVLNEERVYNYSERPKSLTKLI